MYYGQKYPSSLQKSVVIFSLYSTTAEIDGDNEFYKDNRPYQDRQSLL